MLAIKPRVYPCGCLLFMIFLSCKIAVPVDVMSQARSALSRAGEVKADKYAPGEYKKASDYIFLSHRNILEKDTRQAEENARKSLSCSAEAVKKSLPRLSSDNLAKARDILLEVRDLTGEEAADREYSAADREAAGAQDLHNTEAYWDSYLKSQSAIKYSEALRLKALELIPRLKELMKKISADSADLRKGRGADYAVQELDRIDSLIRQATGEIDNKKIRDASPKIREANELLAKTSQKIGKLSAADDIKKAESLLETITATGRADAYTNDIAHARDALKEAKNLYNREAYRESVKKAGEAFNSLGVISDSIKGKEKQGPPRKKTR